MPAHGEHVDSQNLLGAHSGKILIPGPTSLCATILTLHLAHPLHTLPPRWLAVQAASFAVQPWTCRSHAFNAAKLLTAITFDRFHHQNPYRFEHTSFHILVFSQSTSGYDHVPAQGEDFDSPNLLGHPPGKF